MIESRELWDADLRKPLPRFSSRKKRQWIIMQIRQEKGKHTNGPYWMRVWVKGHAKEEETRVVEGPAPQFSCDAIWVGGRGRPPLPPPHPNQPGIKPTSIVRAEFRQQDDVTQTRNSCYLCLKEVMWGARKRNRRVWSPPQVEGNFKTQKHPLRLLRT